MDEEYSIWSLNMWNMIWMWNTWSGPQMWYLVCGVQFPWNKISIQYYKQNFSQFEWVPFRTQSPGGQTLLKSRTRPTWEPFWVVVSDLTQRTIVVEVRNYNSLDITPIFVWYTFRSFSQD
jgi:hypothetical protein